MSDFTYGWGEVGDRSEKFWVKFNACTRTPLSWKEEVFAGARSIARSTKKPLWLCLSGGIDSEALCRAFFEQGIMFSVLTLEHTQGTNSHDIAYARAWCASTGVKHEIVPIDILNFFSVDVDSYVRRPYVTNNVFHYFQLRLMELVEERGGFAVQGTGKLLFSIDRALDTNVSPEVFLDLSVGYAIPGEWFKEEGTQHEPFFFSTTAEMCASYLEEPLIRTALAHPEVFRNRGNMKLLKRMLFHTTWPDMIQRPKYSGFEKIQAQKSAADQKLKNTFGGVQTQSYHLLMNTLRTQLAHVSI